MFKFNHIIKYKRNYFLHFVIRDTFRCIRQSFSNFLKLRNCMRWRNFIG